MHLVHVPNQHQYWYQGRSYLQSCCMSKTDRGLATEIPDRVGRSVGAQAVPAALDHRYGAPQAPNFDKYWR